jgi:hypothetical protein|tara:strand:- start:1374 stop:2132 length:759 start_codon:yes stop_codon:yes gene_type:complete
MAYGNNSNGGSGAGAGKSAQYNDELKAKIQREKISEEQNSSTPRAYGGQPSSGIGSGSKPLPKTISVFSNGSGNGSGSGTGTGIMNGFKVIPPPPIPIPTLTLPTGSERPIDPTEIAAVNIPSISNLTKQVFDKNKFRETIDISFTQLGVQNPLDESFFDSSLATLEDFWTLYDKFFYDIPKEGDTNSHSYLALTSGEYANFELIQEEIQALLDEIGEIRIENVELKTAQSLLEIDLQAANIQLDVKRQTSN